MIKASRFVSVVTSILFTIGLMWSLPSSARDHVVRVDPVDAWTFACKITETDCSQIEMPKVLVVAKGSELYEAVCSQGLIWGFTPYFNSDHDVFLCEAPLFYADQVFIQSVVAHEMTHYLDSVKNPNEDNCTSEWNAHRVGNAYLASHGHLNWADFDWQEWYGCFGSSPDESSSD